MLRRTAFSIGVALAVTVATVAVATSAGAATLFSDDFADGNSTGWTTSGGTWQVTSAEFRQTGTSSDARARAGSTAWTDYTVTARIRPTAFNGSNRFVALLARATSNTNYYYLALRSSNVVELKKLVGGSSTTLATQSLTVGVGTTYTVSLACPGTTLTGRVNGGAPLVATDTQFAAGQIGVATFNASAAFDDITVESGPPGPTPTTTTPRRRRRPRARARPPTSPPPVPPAGQPDGFASLNCARPERHHRWGRWPDR
jgi:pectate lyase